MKSSYGDTNPAEKETYPMSAATENRAVTDASAKLYEAFTHHFGPLDLSAHQPIVKAVSDYAAAARAHDQAKLHEAADHIYVAVTHQFGPRDFGAHDPFVVALSEYGAACAAEASK